MTYLLPERIHYSSIPCSDGRVLGFREDELGEFDDDSDLSVIEGVLRDLGVEPIRLGWGGRLVRELCEAPPPLLWNLNSGIVGTARCAQVPSICEMLGIPLIGSGAWTAALTQDKTSTIAYLSTVAPEIDLPRGLVLIDRRHAEELHSAPFDGPYIIKPNNDDSSRGLQILKEGQEWAAVRSAAIDAMDAWGAVRVEQYIVGWDVSANAVVKWGGHLEPLEPLIIRHGAGAYTGWAKAHMNHERSPLKSFSEAAAEMARGMVYRLCRVLKFRHYARFDLRLEEATSRLFFLEANLCPSFEPKDDFAASAEASGVSYSELLTRVLSAAENDRKNDFGFPGLPTRIRARWHPSMLAEHIRRL